jgi:hypothetical protein
MENSPALERRLKVPVMLRVLPAINLKAEV